MRAYTLLSRKHTPRENYNVQSSKKALLTIPTTGSRYAKQKHTKSSKLYDIYQPKSPPIIKNYNKYKKSNTRNTEPE